MKDKQRKKKFSSVLSVLLSLVLVFQTAFPVFAEEIQTEAAQTETVTEAPEAVSETPATEAQTNTPETPATEALTDGEYDALDFTRYDAAAAALDALGETGVPDAAEPDLPAERPGGSDSHAGTGIAYQSAQQNRTNMRNKIVLICKTDLRQIVYYY